MKKFKLTNRIQNIRGLIEYEKVQFNDQLCKSYNINILFKVQNKTARLDRLLRLMLIYITLKK
jgi:hypothetical protein